MIYKYNELKNYTLEELHERKIKRFEMKFSINNEEHKIACYSDKFADAHKHLENILIDTYGNDLMIITKTTVTKEF